MGVNRLEEPPLPLDSLAAALGLALLHAGAGALRVLDRVPRSRWLSAAGGVALAYVFVHLLPELAEAQAAVEETGILSALERHAYLVALVGIVTFYALEQMARRSKQHQEAGTARERVGWIHVASYSVYNAIIGYVLVQRERDEGMSLWLFAVAMALHFVVNDRGLRAHHGALYHRTGRWLVSGAILGGWAVGWTVAVGEAALGLPLAFIAGGVILNVLKEELPAERDSRLLPFVVAAGVYAAVLVAV